MAKGSKGDSSKPAPPKRPLTAFFLYKDDVFHKTKEENPEAKVTELTKIISEKWKKISDADKEKYNKKNAEAKANYEREMKEYENKHGKVEKKKRASKGKKEKGSKKAAKPKASKKAKEEEEDDEDEEDEEEDEEEEEEEEDDEDDKKKKKKGK